MAGEIEDKTFNITAQVYLQDKMIALEEARKKAGEWRKGRFSRYAQMGREIELIGAALTHLKQGESKDAACLLEEDIIHYSEWIISGENPPAVSTILANRAYSALVGLVGEEHVSLGAQNAIARFRNALLPRS